MSYLGVHSGITELYSHSCFFVLPIAKTSNSRYNRVLLIAFFVLLFVLPLKSCTPTREFVLPLPVFHCFFVLPLAQVIASQYIGCVSRLKVYLTLPLANQRLARGLRISYRILKLKGHA